MASSRRSAWAPAASASSARARGGCSAWRRKGGGEASPSRATEQRSGSIESIRGRGGGRREQRGCGAGDGSVRFKQREEEEKGEPKKLKFDPIQSVAYQGQTLLSWQLRKGQAKERLGLDLFWASWLL